MTEPPPGPFVGRDEELAEAMRSLRDQEVVDLVGPPGVGKTRLALAVAHQFESEVGSTYWIDLRNLAGPDEIAPRLAHSLGLRLASPDFENIAAALRSRQARGLLIFDNVEPYSRQLSEGIERLADLAWASVLMTSREVSGAGKLLRLEGLRDEAAVELVEALSEPKSDKSERASLLALVRSVDGLPLALCLAAPYLDVLSAADLSAAGGLETPLREAIARSWERLDPMAKRVLGAVAVFSGPARADAVAAVAEVALREAARLLSGLHDHSMVQRTRTDAVAFRAYESVREFVLAETPPALLAELEHAHSRLMLSLASQVEQGERGMSDSTLPKLLQGARAELRASCTRTIASKDFASAGKIASALGVDARLSGVVSDFESVATQLWPHRDEVDDLRFFEVYGRMLIDTERIALADRVFAFVKQGFDGPRARFVANVGGSRIAYRRGEVDQGVACGRAACEAAEELTAFELVQARITLGAVLSASTEKEEARRLLTDTAELARESGALREAGVCHYLLSWLWAYEGEPGRQQSAADAAVRIARLSGDTRQLLESLSMLGVALHELGELRSARATFEELSTLASRHGVRRHARRGAELLANVCLEQGDLEEAERFLEIETASIRPEAEPLVHYWIGVQWAILRALEGRVAEARRGLERVVAGAPKLWNRNVQANGIALLATLRWLDGAIEGGTRSHEEAERICDEIDTPLMALRVSLAPASLAIHASSRLDAGRALEPLVEVVMNTHAMGRSSQLRLAVKVIESNLGELRPLFHLVRDNGGKNVLSADGSWFRTSEGEWVDLSSRGRMRDMLVCLVQHDVADLDTLQAAAWPGEKMTASSAANRVRATFSMLRKEGLKDAIRFDQGYALDPNHCVVF